MYSIYFLHSIKNKKYYVGLTNKDPRERLVDHNQGSNQWTRQNGPFKLVYYESYLCQKDAEAREKFYKSGFGRKIRDSIIQVIEGR